MQQTVAVLITGSLLGEPRLEANREPSQWEDDAERPPLLRTPRRTLRGASPGASGPALLPYTASPSLAPVPGGATRGSDGGRPALPGPGGPCAGHVVERPCPSPCGL